MLSSSIAEEALLEAQMVDKLDMYAKNQVDILGVEDTARTGPVRATFVKTKKMTRLGIEPRTNWTYTRCFTN